jgi:hypothetical protein
MNFIKINSYNNNNNIINLMMDKNDKNCIFIEMYIKAASYWCYNSNSSKCKYLRGDMNRYRYRKSDYIICEHYYIYEPVTVYEINDLSYYNLICNLFQKLKLDYSKYRNYDMVKLNTYIKNLLISESCGYKIYHYQYK